MDFPVYKTVLSLYCLTRAFELAAFIIYPVCKSFLTWLAESQHKHSHILLIPSFLLYAFHLFMY